MLPGVGILARAIRRTGFHNLLPTSLKPVSAPRKHVKIDDEERGTAEDNYNFEPDFTTRSSFFRFLKMILLLLLLILLVFLLLAYIVYKPPQFVINYLQHRYPDVLFHLPVPESRRIVALTLDDAPSDETDRILDLLKIYKAKATFFVIGAQIASHPDILQRIHDEGHELGNHAWADEPSISLPLSELERQINEVEAILPPNSPITGSKIAPRYFRPGSGFFSKEMVVKVRSLGYRVVLGSIYPHDPQIRNAKINARHVLSMVQPGGIIIMHDRRSYSASQLELVLGGLKKKKYNVTSLGGLIGVAGIEKAR